jgi:hypothetical protein
VRSSEKLLVDRGGLVDHGGLVGQGGVLRYVHSDSLVCKLSEGYTLRAPLSTARTRGAEQLMCRSSRDDWLGTAYELTRNSVGTEHELIII